MRSTVNFSMTIAYGHSSEVCGTMKCEVKKPECIDDLLHNDLSRITARVHCCCSTNDLCNLRENKYQLILWNIYQIELVI